MRQNIILDPNANALDKLCCGVIFKAVADYRKERFKLNRFLKKYGDTYKEDPELKYQHDCIIFEIEQIRKFFLEENIYWSYTDLDGETLLNEIERRMKRNDNRIKANQRT